MDIEVPYYGEGDAKLGEESLRGDRVDAWVLGISRVDVDKPE